MEKLEKSFEELLAEVGENAQMAQSAPFARLMAVLEGWAEEAKEQMTGNLSPDLAWSFQNRWMQREACVRGVRAWGDGMMKQREDMIEQLKQELTNEYSSSNA